VAWSDPADGREAIYVTTDGPEICSVELDTTYNIVTLVLCTD
jgi:hypothetical protein